MSGLNVIIIITTATAMIITNITRRKSWQCVGSWLIGCFCHGQSPFNKDKIKKQQQQQQKQKKQTSRSGSGTLQPVGHIWPSTDFCKYSFIEMQPWPLVYISVLLSQTIWEEKLKTYNFALYRKKLTFDLVGRFLEYNSC